MEETPRLWMQPQTPYTGQLHKDSPAPGSPSLPPSPGIIKRNDGRTGFAPQTIARQAVHCFMAADLI